MLKDVLNSMEAKRVSQTQLSKATGIPISTISDLLAKKREFNVAHMRKLAEYFHVSPVAFFPTQTVR